MYRTSTHGTYSEFFIFHFENMVSFAKDGVEEVLKNSLYGPWALLRYMY